VSAVCVRSSLPAARNGPPIRIAVNAGSPQPDETTNESAQIEFFEKGQAI